MAIVEPEYVPTGISIRTGLLNRRPTPEIPNSRAPFDDSPVGSVVTVAATAVIAVESNVPPDAGVMVVDAGIVTRISPVGLKTTLVLPLIVTEVAAVVVPEIVATLESVPPVTATETLGVEREPVASAAKVSEASARNVMNATHPTKKILFFIREEKLTC
jgi:hypothetical protein